MSNWISGYYVSECLSDLAVLFREWIRVYSLACENFPQTGERWYVEETIVALLAAAGWKLDIPCILEAKTQRSSASISRDGRADLFLNLAGNITAVEAKIHWFNDLGAFENVLDKLNEACSDASTLDANGAVRRIGLCFGVFEKGGTPIEQLLEGALVRAKAQSLDVTAWCVLTTSPEAIRYPGCIALGRMIASERGGQVWK